MKNVKPMLMSAVLFLCTNLFAIGVGETISYERNSSRTSFLIAGAKGDLKVLREELDPQCGPGYVVNMTYDLDVRIKGPQHGDIDFFLPQALFASLSEPGKRSYGAFDLTHKGVENVTTNGLTYETCSVILADNVNQNYAPVDNCNGQAKVLRMTTTGKIKWVKDLKITIKSHPLVPVVGAVQIDVEGVSDSNIGFKVGFDPKMR